MSNVPDSRATSAPGESRNDHFTDAHQQAIMGAVFRGRRDDILEYGGDEYDG